MVYLVTWCIEIEATSHAEAAQLARTIQLNPQSIATVFGVAGEGEEEDSFKIDTSDPTPG